MEFYIPTISCTKNMTIGDMSETCLRHISDEVYSRKTKPHKNLKGKYSKASCFALPFENSYFLFFNLKPLEPLGVPPPITIIIETDFINKFETFLCMIHATDIFLDVYKHKR